MIEGRMKSRNVSSVYDNHVALDWAALGRAVRGGAVERTIGHLACPEARGALPYRGGCDRDENGLPGRFQMIPRD